MAWLQNFFKKISRKFQENYVLGVAIYGIMVYNTGVR